jgi:hypothetical protein
MPLFSKKGSRGVAATANTAPVASVPSFEMYRTVQTSWYRGDFDLQRQVHFSGAIAPRALKEGLEQLSQPEEQTVRDKRLSGYAPFNLNPGAFSYPLLKHNVLYGDEVEAMLEGCDKPKAVSEEVRRRISRRGLRPLKLPQSAITGVVIEPGESVERLCLGLDMDNPIARELYDEHDYVRGEIYKVTRFDLIPRRPSIAFGEMPASLREERTIEIPFPDIFGAKTPREDRFLASIDEETYPFGAPEKGYPHGINEEGYPFDVAEEERYRLFSESRQSFRDELQQLNIQNARSEVGPATALRLFIEDQINAQGTPPEGWLPVGLRAAEIRTIF